MGSAFAKLAFTPAVQALQTRFGSRSAYARMDGEDGARLGPEEALFLSQRDSFYLSSVSETGWPYLQHRGGPPGFLRVLNSQQLAFADFKGNRQYITVGNLSQNNRVALLLMDYPNRARLKILGRAQVTEDPTILQQLSMEGYKAKVERGILIEVDAFDWNCPQHITPRYTLPEIEAANAPLRERIRQLEAEIARLQGTTS